jgi:hypothetical protein
VVWEILIGILFGGIGFYGIVTLVIAALIVSAWPINSVWVLQRHDAVDALGRRTPVVA